MGLLVYLFGPTDINRAEADLKKAWVVVNTFEDEALQASKDARGHSKRAAEFRQAAEEDKDSAEAAPRPNGAPALTEPRRPVGRLCKFQEPPGWSP